MSRLWPPPASQLRPAPIDCLAADVAVSVIATDLPALWTGLKDDADDDGSAADIAAPYYSADFVRPSDAVFPPVSSSDGAFASEAQRDAVLRVCRLLGVPIVEPPSHVEEVRDPLAAQPSTLGSAVPCAGSSDCEGNTSVNISDHLGA